MSDEKPYIYRSTEEERAFEKKALDVNAMYERANEIISESEINPLDPSYITPYSPAELRADADHVARREKKFEHTPSDLAAKILEALIFEQGELSEWFGQYTQVIRASLYDDVVNGTDFILKTKIAKDGGREGGEQIASILAKEKAPASSYLALGIDVTFGTRRIKDKFDHVKKRIDAGELGEIKYCPLDDVDNEKGSPGTKKLLRKRNDVPQVILGVEIERIHEIALLWQNRRNKELATHPIQITLLEEAILQLEQYAEYARGNDKPVLAQKIEIELAVLQNILAKKKGAGLRGLKNDKVFEEIKFNLLHFYVIPDAPPAVKTK